MVHLYLKCEIKIQFLKKIFDHYYFTDVDQANNKIYSSVFHEHDKKNSTQKKKKRKEFFK